MKQMLSIFLIGIAVSAYATPPVIKPDTVGRATASPYVSRNRAMSVAVFPNLDYSKMHLMVENHVNIPLYVSFFSDTEQLYKVRVGKHLKAFHSKFDVSQLKDGDYHIEVSDGGLNRVVKTFHITTVKNRITSTRQLTTIE